MRREGRETKTLRLVKRQAIAAKKEQEFHEKWKTCEGGAHQACLTNTRLSSFRAAQMKMADLNSGRSYRPPMVCRLRLHSSARPCLSNHPKSAITKTDFIGESLTKVSSKRWPSEGRPTVSSLGNTCNSRQSFGRQVFSWPLSHMKTQPSLRCLFHKISSELRW